MFISEQRSTDLLSNLRECDEYGNYTTWLPDPALPATQASESSGDCCFYKQITSPYWDDNNACISIFFLIMESITKEPLRHKKDDFGEYDVILSVAWEMATTATTEMMSDALGCLDKYPFLKIIIDPARISEEGGAVTIGSLCRQHDILNQSQVARDRHAKIARITIVLNYVSVIDAEIEASRSTCVQDTITDLWCAFLFFHTCKYAVNYLIEYRTSGCTPGGTAVLAELAYLFQLATIISDSPGHQERCTNFLLAVYDYTKLYVAPIDPKVKLDYLRKTIRMICDLDRGVVNGKVIITEESTACKASLQWNTVMEFVSSIDHKAVADF